MKTSRVNDQDKLNALHYYEVRAKNYSKTSSLGPLKYFRRREYKCVLKSLQMDDSVRSFIDLGCGAGFYSLAAKRQGIYVCAVDASPSMIKGLRHKVDEARVADVESLDESRKFDRVLCAGVLDFVSNPEIAFSNLCRLVAPGGLLVILAPCEGPFSWIYRFEKRLFGLKVNFYTLEWFSKMAELQGLLLLHSVHPLPTNLVAVFSRPKVAPFFANQPAFR